MFGFQSKFNVLVLGSNGMLGTQLMDVLRKHSIDKRGYINIVHGLDYPEIDLGKRCALNSYLDNSIHYDYIINCSAITDTKAIEGNLKDTSYRINALAVKWIAKACKAHKSKLIHISTDYVFSENTISYSDEDDGSLTYANMHSFISDEFPVNTYGMHKLIGELFIKTEMDHDEYAIMRVSWLYGMHGNKSFVHRFLKNCMNKLNEQFINSGELKSVDVLCITDEFSFPTSCISLCDRICKAMTENMHGVIHACDGPKSYCSVERACVSRYEFAAKILDSMKKFIPELEKVNLIKANDINNSAMRYPKMSGMNFMDEYRNIKQWVDAWDIILDNFISENAIGLKTWLYEGTKFIENKNNDIIST